MGKHSGRIVVIGGIKFKLMGLKQNRKFVGYMLVALDENESKSNG